MLERSECLAMNKREGSQEGALAFICREERRPSHFQTYLNRHINYAERNDDDDEGWSGQADHEQGAHDPQEAQNPTAQGHGERVVHGGNILGTHN